MTDDPRTEPIWLPIPGWEGLYDVSDHGLIRSVRSSKLMNPSKNTSGYYVTGLSRNGVATRMLVHRAVLLAFVGPCPEGMEACHGDTVRTNNHLSNLRWDTRSANTLDQVRAGIHNEARKTHCPAGHAYTEMNTRFTPEGHRKCRTCHRERKRQTDARRKAARDAQDGVA